DAPGSRDHVGEPHRSNRNAPEVLWVLPEGGDDLGGATADVDDRPTGLGWRAVQNAQADQARLLPARDDLQGQRRALADPARHFAAIGRLAQRAGRDGADSRLVPAAKRRIPAQGGEQALDHFLIETSGGEHALTRPDGIALLMERLEERRGGE